MELKTKIDHLNRLVLEGRALEAFDRYYADDVVMQEGEAEPTVGKEANRDREEDFFGNVIEFRNAEVHSVSVGNDTTAVEWTFDYVHREWGAQRYRQVAVQRWKNGKIVEERFYRAA